MASCGQLDRAMPLDALLAALTALLRRLGPEVTADLLGADATVLAPLLAAAPGPRPQPVLGDSMLGPALLYAALVRMLGRLTERAPLVVVIDDAHLAGPALPDWVRFARREAAELAIVAAVRPGAGAPLPATTFIHLDVLGLDAAAELVGPARVGRAVRALEGASAVPHRAGAAGRGRGAARVAGRVGVRPLR